MKITKAVAHARLEHQPCIRRFLVALLRGPVTIHQRRLDPAGGLHDVPAVTHLASPIRALTLFTGVEQVHAVLGGFHLSGSLFEPIIVLTCAGLANLAPRVLVSAHCTGWRATHAIAARLPTAFIQNSVGTTYQF